MRLKRGSRERKGTVVDWEIVMVIVGVVVVVVVVVVRERLRRERTGGWRVRGGRRRWW